MRHDIFVLNALRVDCSRAPLHTCTRDTIAQASRAFCDVLAINVGIVRKACREGRCTMKRTAVDGWLQRLVQRLCVGLWLMPGALCCGAHAVGDARFPSARCSLSSLRRFWLMSTRVDRKIASRD